MQFIKITTQQHYMPICVANSIYLGSNQEHQSRMKTKFHAKQYDRFIETNQSVRGASQSEARLQFCQRHCKSSSLIESRGAIQISIKMIFHWGRPIHVNINSARNIQGIKSSGLSFSSAEISKPLLFRGTVSPAALGYHSVGFGHFLISWDPKSYVVQQLVRELVYIPCL